MEPEEQMKVVGSLDPQIPLNSSLENGKLDTEGRV